MNLKFPSIIHSPKLSKVVPIDIDEQSPALQPTDNAQAKPSKSSPPSAEASRKANLYAEQMRLNLGEPMKNSIAFQRIPTRGGENVELMQIMQKYAQAIGSKLSENDVKAYISIGERLVNALNEGRLQEDGTLLVQTQNGSDMRIHSNLETSRAVSWYLQAKAAMDNASPDREPTLLQRGSMLMKDEDGKLFRFLNSAPNAYGRISSHFNERSSSEIAGFRNTGVMGKLCGLLQPSAAQRGIEDFSGRFPGCKGTMLFDQLHGKDGSTQIFLKWEEAGMPTILGEMKHADKEEGKRAALRNHIKAFGRCAAHTVNFASLLAGPKNTDPSLKARRENLSGENTKLLFDEFKKIVQESAQNVGTKEAKETIKAGKERGLYHIKDILQDMKETYQSDKHVSGFEKKIARIDALLGKIQQFESDMGNDFGLERKGAEVHASLDTSYLTNKTANPRPTTLADLLAQERP